MRPGGDGGSTFRDILFGVVPVIGDEGKESEGRRCSANRQRMSRSRRSVRMQLRLAGRHYIPDYEFRIQSALKCGYR